MTIKVSCNCGKTIAVRDEFAGRRVSNASQFALTARQVCLLSVSTTQKDTCFSLWMKACPPSLFWQTSTIRSMSG